MPTTRRNVAPPLKEPAPDRAVEEWQLDPTLVSLRESAWRGDELPSPSCTEVGRRMLLAELEFSEWVLRRVEKVQFERDRSVSRRLSIDLSVRPDAPVLVDADQRRYWLLPLSIMRRRTLVNLDLRDEGGESLTLLGLRLAQKLDQSMLRAAAAAAGVGPGDTDEVDDFIRQLVAGDRTQVKAQWKRFGAAEEDPEDPMHDLASNALFAAVVCRLRRGFSLYAVLPVALGRHRLIRMSFDEPTDWHYRTPHLERMPDESYRYEDVAPAAEDEEEQPAEPARRRTGLRPRLFDRTGREQLRAALGLSATRVRFQVPSAENATSYHFEITAPSGVRIVKATLLAGRPNQEEKRISADGVTGHSTIVGLHAVEIPFGSLCRAQVDLRVPARGWLTTLTVSCLLVLVLLGSVTGNLFVVGGWTDTQVTNVVLMLITLSAGAATYVAQRDAGGVAARMVARLRLLGVLSIALPAVGAGFLVFYGVDSLGTEVLETVLALLTGVALVLAVFVAVVWERSFREGRLEVKTSPWDMTNSTPHVAPSSYHTAVKELQFDTPAVVIDSAEDWRHRYGWSDDLQKCATEALLSVKLPAEPTGISSPATALRCHCTGACMAMRRARAGSPVPGAPDGVKLHG